MILRNLTCGLFLGFSALPALASIVSGPERQVGQRALGVPATQDMQMRIASNGDGFLATFQSDRTAYVMPLDRHGEPAGELALWRGSPAPAAIASDGQRYLALRQTAIDFVPVSGFVNYTLSATLFDSDGSTVHEVTIVDARPVNVGERSVVWTGRDYLVVWMEHTETLVRGIRVSREGELVGEPFDVLDTRWRELPFVASDGAFSYVAVNDFDLSSRETIAQLVRIGPLNEVLRLSPDLQLAAIYDIAASARSVFLLGRRSGEAGSIAIYTFPVGTMTTMDWPLTDGIPRLLPLGDGVLLFGSRGSEITAQEFSTSGERRGPQRPLLDLCSSENSRPWAEGMAATNGQTIVFVWAEECSRTLDPMFARLGTRFLESRADGVPDGRLLTRGTPAQTDPDIAVSANGDVLTVWVESGDDGHQLMTELTHPDGRRATSTLGHASMTAAPAAASNGSTFFVVWSTELRTSGPVEAKLVGRVMRRDGTAGPEREIAVTRGAGRVMVTAHQSRYMVAWSETYPSYPSLSSTAMGRRYDADGDSLDPDPQLLVDRLEGGWDPWLASDGANLLLVWTSGVRCIRAACGPTAYFDVRGRIVDGSLTPQSSDFTIAADRSADEDLPVASSSGAGWLVAWRARRRVFDGFLFEYLDIGHAHVSGAGFTSAVHEPLLEDRVIRRHAPSVIWSGRDYIVAYQREVYSPFQSTRAVAGMTVSREGHPLVRETIIAPGGLEPRLTPSSGGGLLSYSRSAPELGIGAAPQVFRRDLTSMPIRRRVAGVGASLFTFSTRSGENECEAPTPRS